MTQRARFRWFRRRVPAAAAGRRELLAVSPSGGRGGAETMLFRLVVVAASRGWRVRCLVPRGPLQDDLRAAGVEVLDLPALRLAGGPRLLAALRLLVASARAAVRVRRAARGSDVVLANGLLVLPALCLLPASASRVWWAHDVLVRGDRLRVARACGRLVDVVVGVSDAVLQPLQAVGRRHVLVRNGVDAGGAGVIWTPPPYVIGCNAALTPWKGQDMLLEAVALLEGPVLQLLGAAQPQDGPYEQALHERAADADLRGRVQFLGHVADPAAVMVGWHVGVSASVDPEASGLGLIEGMSLGVPQVATDHGGPREVLGEAGLLVPARDAGAMATALRRLLEDRVLWQRCSQAGPRIVRAGLHRPDQEQAFLVVLEDAARTCRDGS